MAEFIATLQALSKGKTVDDLSQALTDVVAAVEEVGGKGKLTLTLSISRPDKSDGRQVLIEDAIVSKLPKPDRQITLMFAHEGNLSRSPFDQQDLFDPRRVGLEPEDHRDTEAQRAAAGA